MANFANRASEADLNWALNSLQGMDCLNQNVTNSAFSYVSFSDINAKQLLLGSIVGSAHALVPDQVGSDKILSLTIDSVIRRGEFLELLNPEEHWSWYTTNIVEPSRNGLIEAYKTLLTNPRETLVLQEMFTTITEKLQQNHRLVMSEWTFSNGELHKFEKKSESGFSRDRHLVL